MPNGLIDHIRIENLRGSRRLILNLKSRGKHWINVELLAFELKFDSNKFSICRLENEVYKIKEVSDHKIYVEKVKKKKKKKGIQCTWGKEGSVPYIHRTRGYPLSQLEKEPLIWGCWDLRGKCHMVHLIFGLTTFDIGKCLAL